MDYQMEELLPIVSELAWKFSGCESASISYEKTQSLMEGVIYCLEEYHHSSQNIPARGAITVKEKYEIGARLVSEKAADVRNIFNALVPQFEDFGVICLHDTVRKGIPQFLKWYDVKFCPQDTLLTLDYPLLFDLTPLKGVDAVHKYICAVCIEQKFLNQFDKNYILQILEKYDCLYVNMIENICGIVLLNTVGHLAIQKPFIEIGFDEDDYRRLSDIFSQKSAYDIEQLIKHIIKTMVSQFYENDASMSEYLDCSAKNASVRIHTAVQYAHLDKIFLI